MLLGSRGSSSSVTRYFGDARCRSIWQWQLILAFTVVAISAGVALLTPARFGDWCFALGGFAVVVFTVVSLAVPWHRVPSTGVLVLPVLDALAIGLMAAGSPSTAFLWVFPVAWVGAYFSTGVLIGILGLIGALRAIGLLVDGTTDASTISAVILMIILTFVGVIMAVGSERNRSARRLLRVQSDRLAHALQRVSEQKARNRRVLDSLDLGVARVGSGGVIEVSNEAFRVLFALDDAAPFHPSRVVEYRSRRGVAVPADATSIARASRGELFADEIAWLFGVDGQWRAVSASTKAIDHGLVTGDGLLLIVEDVTAVVDPRAGDDARRRTISHELRNPLTAIVGHIDLLLERDDLAAASRAQLEVVERAGARMQQLIEQGLTASDERDDDAGVDFDLADIARASLEGFAPTADSTGVMVESDLGERLSVCGDAFRLRQVVDNVVGNAIKYAQRGGRVFVQGFRPAPGEVALRISDTGIGIDQDDLPRIFEREFRTEVARERGIPGTGLGLSISRDIIVAEQGRFEVSSELGQGTEVTVVLPAAHEPGAARTARQTPEAPETPESPEGSSA